jgi:anti-anti-sigma regulatory factor
MPVTLKIETTPGKRFATIRLIGRIQTEHLSELIVQLDAAGPNVVLDFSDVSIVNLDVVRFLGECESRGIQLINCPTYIRRWCREVGGKVKKRQDPAS